MEDDPALCGHTRCAAVLSGMLTMHVGRIPSFPLRLIAATVGVPRATPSMINALVGGLRSDAIASVGCQQG